MVVYIQLVPISMGDMHMIKMWDFIYERATEYFIETGVLEKYDKYGGEVHCVIEIYREKPVKIKLERESGKIIKLKSEEEKREYKEYYMKFGEYTERCWDEIMEQKFRPISMRRIKSARCA